jgi:hypothetical protein
MTMMNTADAPAPTAAARTPRPARTPRRPADQPPKATPARLAKSKDASKVKASYYLSAQTAEKVGVASIIRRVDQSDLVDEILARALSSVAYYDRSPGRGPCEKPAGGVDLATEVIGGSAGT